jgi:hypothetical protein
MASREGLKAVDAATGQIVSAGKVSLGTPVLGGRYLFGGGTVATAERQPRVVGTRSPWYEMSDRSIAFAGHRMLVRTRTGMVCIGKTKGQ